MYLVLQMIFCLSGYDSDGKDHEHMLLVEYVHSK